MSVSTTTNIGLPGAVIRYHCSHNADRHSWRLEVGQDLSNAVYLTGTIEELKALADAVLVAHADAASRLQEATTDGK
jgi:hypothetical protein